MICNMCNERDAVLLVQQVTFGGKKEVHLCPRCAKDRGIDVGADKIGPSIENLISSITVTKKACYVCGKNLEDIQKSGLVGCAECYVAFSDEIQVILESKGIDTPYTGSMPNKLEHFRSILTDRIEIQKKLDNSVAHEEFEKAAMYRDFLRTLEKTAISDADAEGDFFDK